MVFDPTPGYTRYTHLVDVSTLDKIQGANLENEFDSYDDCINELYGGPTALVEANITALRAVVDADNYTSDDNDVPCKNGQIRTVVAVSDGTNTTRCAYMFVSGIATADAEAGNTDTDGIVSPTNAGVDGRWIRIAPSHAITNRGVVALRTLFNRLVIDLDTDTVTDDVVLRFIKRAAGTQNKILTNEEVAIRNAADNAYEDFAAAICTLSGNLLGSGTANILSGVPVASATSALLRLGAAVVGGSASGQVIAINAPAAFAGNLLFAQVDGAASVATLTAAGALTLASALTVSTSGAAITGDSSVAGNLSLTGTGVFSATGAGSFGGALDMNSHQIEEVTNGDAGSQDACTVAQMEDYADAAVSDLVAGQFSPVFIDTCSTWIAADKITGVADAGNVTTWSDLSGMANHFTNNKTAPTYRINVINALPVVRFVAGSTTGLQSALNLSSVMAVGEKTMYLVIRTPAVFDADAAIVGSAYVLWFDGNNGGAVWERFSGGPGAVGANGYYYGYDGTSDETNSNAVFAASTNYICEFQHDGVNLSFKVNNSAAGTAASGNSSTLAAPLLLGHTIPDAATVYSTVDIAELIIFNEVLSGIKLSRIRSYLGNKYNIAV